MQNFVSLSHKSSRSWSKCLLAASILFVKVNLDKFANAFSTTSGIIFLDCVETTFETKNFLSPTFEDNRLNIAYQSLVYTGESYYLSI